MSFKFKLIALLMNGWSVCRIVGSFMKEVGVGDFVVLTWFKSSFYLVLGLVIFERC